MKKLITGEMVGKDFLMEQSRSFHRGSGRTWS